MDLLVKLYDLPDETPGRLPGGPEIRRALSPEKHVVLDWVGLNFSPRWVSECDLAFARSPIACFLAVHEGFLCGFCCYAVTCPDFLGPIGVAAEWRNRGVGAELLLAGLRALRDAGYAYGIIGWAGSPGFFQRVAGAIVIENSEPGFYKGLLRTTSRPSNEEQSQ